VTFTTTQAPTTDIVPNPVFEACVTGILGEGYDDIDDTAVTAEEWDAAMLAHTAATSACTLEIAQDDAVFMAAAAAFRSCMLTQLDAFDITADVHPVLPQLITPWDDLPLRRIFDWEELKRPPMWDDLFGPCDALRTDYSSLEASVFYVEASSTITTTTTTEPPGLDWPDDVGASHLGHLSAGRIGGPGSWRRPHPGPFQWGLSEPSPGLYAWDRTDGVVNAIQTERIAILVTLWPFAEWDQAACHADDPKYPGMLPELGESLYAPCDLDAYAAWVAATVERYDGDGVDDMPGLAYPIRHWEVFNEPEMQGPENLAMFQAGPDAYLELLRVSAAAIRGADPLAVVLLAGQAGMHDQFLPYWEPVLSGAAGLFDLGNIHSIKSSDTFFAADYRSLIDATGHGDRAFWITEAYVGDRGGLGRSDDELAKVTITGAVTAFSEGAEMIIVAGLTKVPQSVLDAWDVVDATIAAFQTVESLTVSSSLFTMSDGTFVYALWDGAALPDSVTGPVRTVRYDGLEAEVDASEVDTTLPILVVVSG